MSKKELNSSKISVGELNPNRYFYLKKIYYLYESIT